MGRRRRDNKVTATNVEGKRPFDKRKLAPCRRTRQFSLSHHKPRAIHQE